MPVILLLLTEILPATLPMIGIREYIFINSHILKAVQFTMLEP